MKFLMYVKTVSKRPHSCKYKQYQSENLFRTKQINMQRNPGTRLQDISTGAGFPPHIAKILNPGKEIKFSEILCRLIHVCMIETGFVPIIDSEPDYAAGALCEMTKDESVPQLITRLQEIILKKGSLHNVQYKAIVMKEYTVLAEPLVSSEDRNKGFGMPVDFSDKSDLSKDEYLLEKKTDVCDVTTARPPLTSKESGDGSLIVSPANNQNIQLPSTTSWQKAYSENIAVNIIHDGSDILVMANGPGVHRNAQVSVSEFSNYQIIPKAATAREYLAMIDFKAASFATDVKRSFCYQIMDDIYGLSFEIRSLACIPPEIIVKIARCCASQSVIRLRNTCSEIRGALSPTNAQFWKRMIKKYGVNAGIKICDIFVYYK